MVKRYEYERYLLNLTPKSKQGEMQAILQEIREFRTRMYEKRPAVSDWSTTDIGKALVLLTNQAVGKIIFLPLIDVRQGKIPKKNLPKYQIWDTGTACQNALVDELIDAINDLIKQKIPPQFYRDVEHYVKLTLDTLENNILVNLFSEKVDTLLTQAFDKYRFYDWFNLHQSFLNKYDEIPIRIYENLFASLITLLQIFIYSAHRGDKKKVEALRLLLNLYPACQIWGYNWSPHNIGKRPLTWYAIV